jgi:hypothetical protein
MAGAMKEQDRKTVLELKSRLSADLQKRVSAVPQKREYHFTGTWEKKGFSYEGEVMKAVKRKITDMTVDELKDVIHEAIAEDMEVWRETFEIMADGKLMRQIR